MLKRKERSGVAICPGPNLAYFSGIYSLEEMVGHIYGKIDLLRTSNRANIFINELNLYIDYLNREISNCVDSMNDKKVRYFQSFKDQLQQGINYYKQLIPQMTDNTRDYIADMFNDLALSEQQLCTIAVK